MRGFGSSLGCLAIAIVLISPMVLIVLMPLAIGLGVNLFDLIGEVPVIIVLFAPMALHVARTMSSAAINTSRNPWVGAKANSVVRPGFLPAPDGPKVPLTTQFTSAPSLRNPVHQSAAVQIPRRTPFPAH
jgi:hypothetical protein